jgi:hypothetical protein
MRFFEVFSFCFWKYFCGVFELLQRNGQKNAIKTIEGKTKQETSFSPLNSFVGAIAPTGTTKAHRRYRDHLWTFAVYRSPVDV